MSSKNKSIEDSKSADKLPVIFVGVGIGLLILGFIILSMVNRMATNWAGFAAPAFLVSGWVVIAVGLWKGEK